MDWKSGDWCVFELSVGQIKELREGGGASFSEGTFETSGQLTNRFRPLTLKNKRLVEYFDHYYSQLREIDGEAGFNYPDIHRYFAQLAIDAIDSDDAEEFCKLAQDFVKDARDHKNPIQGVSLFRPNFRRAARG